MKLLLWCSTTSAPSHFDNVSPYLLQAFEHLLQRELICFTDNRGHSQSIEFRQVKLVVSYAELQEGLKSYRSCPVSYSQNSTCFWELHMSCHNFLCGLGKAMYLFKNWTSQPCYRYVIIWSLLGCPRIQFYSCHEIIDFYHFPPFCYPLKSAMIDECVILIFWQAILLKLIDRWRQSSCAETMLMAD